VALIIFMVQVPADGPTYGYSFAFAWVSIPFAVAAAVLFFSLEVIFLIAKQNICKIIKTYCNKLYKEYVVCSRIH